MYKKLLRHSLLHFRDVQSCSVALRFVSIFDKELMHIWSPSLCLALICFISSVHSRCNDDSECGQWQVCCGNFCASRSVCDRRCTSDADCSIGDECDSSSGKCVTPTNPPTWPSFPGFPTSKTDRCYWDSDCFRTSTCINRQCVDREDNNSTPDSDGGGLSRSTTKIVGIVFFAALAAVISCLYHMCKNARRQPANSQTVTAVAGEGRNTAHGTDHEMRPTGNAVSNGGVVIAVEEVNEVSPPLPPGAPPPYSTLEFEPQQRGNENEEQPPPSYDEAVGNSTMALV